MPPRSPERRDRDDALARRTPLALAGLRETALAQQLDRALRVAAGVGEHLLAIHHAGASLLAQRFHRLRRNLRHC